MPEHMFKETIYMLDISFFALLVIILAIPKILPDYPLSLTDILFSIPKDVTDIGYIIFLACIAISLVDLFIIMGLRKGLIMRRLHSDVRDLICSMIVAGLPIYGLLIEFLAWIEMIDGGFLIFFITISATGYIIAKVS